MSDRSFDRFDTRAESLEKLSRQREAEKDRKLKEADAKRLAKEAEYRRAILSKLIAPVLLIVTVFIGWLLWSMAQ